ncbi:hypothetical protein [Ornithinibacillus sp. 179-J 7C1 HS]|uniref:hypothetical protein n=1 Tax=Ornithinibacillus sp. 179-J 7C1 HS TaxID=3142384 RepID=UPI0039A1D5E8
MKKVSIIIMLAIIMILVSACSQDKEEEKSNTESSSSTGDNSGVVNQEDSEEDQPTNTTESDGNTPDFDVEDYLNEQYSLDNTHYVTEEWVNEELGITNYTVKILPDTKEFGQEITDIFVNGSPNFDDDRTIEMFEVAEKIMNDLPTIHDNIHIDSVNWVSYDGEFSVMLIQDFENSGSNVGNKGDDETLSHYSSEQIEYARVWLELGPNQALEELYVRHIPAGTPLNPNDDTSASYPEDVIQLAGTRLVDGTVTYSGNGDGTINVYNVPLRWDGKYPAGKQFYTDIIENTELVYIDPGEDEKVINLINLLNLDQ